MNGVLDIRETAPPQSGGQLNSCVIWYKQYQMTSGDQLPIGILLCTHKNNEMVEFALADISNKLFVSRHQVGAGAEFL